MRYLAPLLFVLICTAHSHGAVTRVEISKTNQSESPIEYSVAIIPDAQQEGHLLVELILPSGQPELADLWQACLWVQQAGKTVLAAPLEVSAAEDKKLAIRFHGHADNVRQCLVAIRCGKHAPRSETIFQIDIGSYLNRN